MHYGTCFLCGKRGWLEDHHVFPASLRDKSEEYGFVIGLCGETCHRNGKKAAHACRETADALKEHCQILYMLKYGASVYDFRQVFDKNRLDEAYYEDERRLPMNIGAWSGRLSQDPVLRHTKDNQAVCSFTVAVKRPGTKDKVDFLEFTAWHEKANFISKYFKKGKRIELTGSVIRDDYEKDGEKRKSYKIQVKDVHFCDDKKDDERDREDCGEYDVPEEDQDSGFSEMNDDDSDLPF